MDEPVDELIACCSECKSDVPDSFMNKNPFFQQGSPVPCPFCGGVILIVMRSDRDNSLRKSDNNRGIGTA